MSRRRGCLWFAAGLLLALMAGLAAFVTLQRAASMARPTVEEPPRIRVVVAARDIELHTLLQETDLAFRDVPPELAPTDAVLDLKDALGKLTTVDIARDEIIIGRRLIAPDYVGPRAAFVVDPAKVIVAFPTHDLLGSLDIIRPGDHVDIMLSFDFSKGVPDVFTGMNTFTVLQDVQIAAVIRGPGSDPQQAAGRGPIQAVLLALDPQDALTLKYFRDAGAAPDFALRSPAASGPFDVVPVDGELVLKRFQIRYRAK